MDGALVSTFSANMDQVFIDMACMTEKASKLQILNTSLEATVEKQRKEIEERTCNMLEKDRMIIEMNNKISNLILQRNQFLDRIDQQMNAIADAANLKYDVT